MQIKVTQQHIDAGIKLLCDACPVALALSEATGGMHWGVTGWAAWERNTHRRAITLPRAVLQFVTDYDRGEPVEPFEFTFDFEKEQV
jgi:hypothetical protein